MNKSWIIIVAIALITMIGIAMFEFFQSLSGQNVEFVRGITNTSVPADLGTQELEFINLLSSNVIITDEQVETGQFDVSPTQEPVNDDEPILPNDDVFFPE